MKTILLSILLFAFSFMNLSATEFNVINENDAGVGSLRQAILDANKDLTATLQSPHTITTDASYSINCLSSLPGFTNYVKVNPVGSNVLTINAFSSFRVMLISDAWTVELNNIVFQGANEVPSSGALAVGGASTATLNNCTFQYNSSPISAIVCYGSLNCNNCKFNDNVCTNNGNGSIISIVRAPASVNITNCIFENNSGGPVIKDLVPGTTLNITNCIIRNNMNEGTSTSNHGGGVASTAITTITNTEISGNSALRGAGVSLMVGNANYKSKLTMTNCTVSGNTASFYGGGVWIQGQTTSYTDSVKLTNCTISGNKSTQTGAGISFNAGTNALLTNVLTLNNCTITGNVVDDNINTTTATGGGIDRSTGFVILNYCIVAGNNPTSTSDNKDIKVLSTALNSSTGRNLFGGAPSFDYDGAELTGNIPYSDDINKVLNTTLTDNGGKVTLPDGSHLKTHALLSGSLAIDPSKAVSVLQKTDQRDFSRDATPDMGAYEFNAQTALNNIMDEKVNVYQIGADQIVVDLTKLVGIQTIMIYDIEGRNVINRQLNGGEKQLISAKLNNGIYLVRIQGNEKPIVAKLVLK